MTRSAVIVNPVTGVPATVLTRIDTGDDIPLIDENIVGPLGLVPHGSVSVEGVAGVPDTVNLYLVDVSLGHDGYAAGVQVAGYKGLARSIGVSLLTGDTLLDRGFLWRDGPGRQWGFTIVGSGVSTSAGPSPWIVGGGALALAGIAAVAVGLRR